MAHFGPHLAALGLKLDELLEGPTREGWQNRYQAYTEAGVPKLLARMVAGTTHLYTLLVTDTGYEIFTLLAAGIHLQVQRNLRRALP